MSYFAGPPQSDTLTKLKPLIRRKVEADMRDFVASIDLE